MLKQIRYGPWFAGMICSSLCEYEGEEWVLGMQFIRGGPARVLDQFSSLDEAEEALEIFEKWIRSHEYTQAMLLNTEDAIVNSWQDFSLIDHFGEQRAAAAREMAELTAIPGYGMF